MLGMNEIVIIILAIVLLLVGSKKIPELARAMGRAMGEFKRGKMEMEKEIREMDLEKPVSSNPAASGGKADIKLAVSPSTVKQ